jgi:hypothetical protein
MDETLTLDSDHQQKLALLPCRLGQVWHGDDLS